MCFSTDARRAAINFLLRFAQLGPVGVPELHQLLGLPLARRLVGFEGFHARQTNALDQADPVVDGVAGAVPVAALAVAVVIVETQVPRAAHAG